MEEKDSQAFEQQDYSREQAETGLMPTAQDYGTIGHLYEAIRTNLSALDRQLGGSTLFLGDEGAQIGGEIIVWQAWALSLILGPPWLPSTS